MYLRSLLDTTCSEVTVDPMIEKMSVIRIMWYYAGELTVFGLCRSNLSTKKILVSSTKRGMRQTHGNPMRTQAGLKATTIQSVSYQTANEQVALRLTSWIS